MTSLDPGAPRAMPPSTRPEPASPIEPPPRARLEQLASTLLEPGRRFPPPGLPQVLPDARPQPTKAPSLLLVGEALGTAAEQNLRQRGFRRIIDVDDIPDALGALSERRYDAIAIWDYVDAKPVRFVRALLGFDPRSEPRPFDPLLPLLVSRVRDVPIAVLSSTGGFALFRSGGDWYLSESGGLDWTDALLTMASSGR